LAIRLFVIIPVYGNWEDTVECLKALDSQTTSDFQILIADDGSPAPPPPSIVECGTAHYLRGQNLGYGANCSRAALEALARGATHFLFLNNDTSFGPAFIETWIRRAGEFPNAIISPLIYWADHPERVWSSGGKFTVLTPFVRARADFDTVTKVDTVTGCALMISADAWTAVGGFDRRYAMYFEDFDLTLRARQKGIATYIVPDSELKVLHRVSGSFRQAGAWKKHYFMVTSTLIFIRRHYKGARKPICIALSFAHLAWTAILNLPEMPAPRLLWRALIRGFTE
jgi:GT2 family glycosyltransferase